MYHDHPKNNKYLSLKKQQIKNVSPPFFSDAKSEKPRTFKKFTKLISKLIIRRIDHIYLKLMRHPL